MTNWRIWIENGPRISPYEIALLAAAVLFLYAVPVVLSWSAARRRKRIQRRETMATWIAAPEGAEGVAVPAAEGTGFGAMASEMHEQSAEIPATEPHASLDPWPVVSAAETAEAPEPILPPEPELRPQDPGVAPSSRPLAGSSSPLPTNLPPLEIQPLEGVARHRFRLQELRRVSLPGAPAEAIRADADRQRIWTEAERLIQTHWEQLGAVVIASPYPARSMCLGAAETAGDRYRIHIWLFPGAWPVAQGEAVAQAVFEVEAAGGVIRGWVDALRVSELSPDHRREIIASGGEA